MRIILTGVCAAAVMVWHEQAMQAARMAAQTFAQSVMPALFPMMVLGRMLPAGSPVWASVVFAMLSGAPASAQRTAQLWREGRLVSAERMMALCGVMSPMFFVGSLAGWIGDAQAAWKLLMIHWLGAVIAWACFGKPSPLPDEAESQSAAVPLPAAISQSAAALLGVCGAMMLFSIAAAVVRTGCLQLFPDWTAHNAKLFSVLHAVMEIGSGTHAMLQAWERPPYALLCAVCGFGGLSIWLQNLLFAPQCIRPAKLLWMRMLHGAAGYGLGRLIFS